MAKFFNLFKNSDKVEGDNKPDYRITFEEDREFIEGGACWKKKDKNGVMFLSCKLRDEYKEKPGYQIAVEGSTKGKTAPSDDL